MELGPYTLDVLVQQPPSAAGDGADGGGDSRPVVVIEVRVVVCTCMICFVYVHIRTHVVQIKMSN